jgi:hypothetical protein
MIHDGRIREEGIVPYAGMLVSIEPPASDCLELHVDVTRGIVMEVRSDGVVLATYFMDDFARGLNPVRFTIDGPPADVSP